MFLYCELYKLILNCKCSIWLFLFLEYIIDNLSRQLGIMFSYTEALSQAESLKDKWLHLPKNTTPQSVTWVLKSMKTNAQKIMHSRYIHDVIVAEEMNLEHSSVHGYYTPNEEAILSGKSKFHTLQKVICRRENWLTPNRTGEKRLNYDSISWLEIDPDLIREWLYRGATWDIWQSFSSEIVGRSLHKIKHFLKEWKPFPEKLAWEHGFDWANPYRILYWEAPKRKQPNVVNTSCRILHINKNSADYFENSYDARRQVWHMLDNINHSLEDIAWYEGILWAIRTLLYVLEKEKWINHKLNEITSYVSRNCDSFAPIFKLKKDQESFLLAITKWANRYKVRFTLEQWKKLLELSGEIRDEIDLDNYLSETCQELAIQALEKSEHLKTNDGKSLHLSMNKLWSLEDIKKRWNPSELLAVLTKAERLVRQRKNTLGKQQHNLDVHHTILSNYIKLHEQRFDEKYWHWHSEPLLLED